MKPQDNKEPNFGKTNIQFRVPLTEQGFNNLARRAVERGYRREYDKTPNTDIEADWTLQEKRDAVNWFIWKLSVT